jgi:hypothetical protein
LAGGRRLFFVRQCAIDNKAEKKTDHDERGDEDVNHGLAPLNQWCFLVKAMIMPFSA